MTENIFEEVKCICCKETVNTDTYKVSAKKLINDITEDEIVFKNYKRELYDAYYDNEKKIKEAINTRLNKIRAETARFEFKPATDKLPAYKRERNSVIVHSPKIVKRNEGFNYDSRQYPKSGNVHIKHNFINGEIMLFVNSPVKINFTYTKYDENKLNLKEIVEESVILNLSYPVIYERV